jgi:hypothetical protein
MLNQITQYIQNVQDPQSNFNLALEYEALGQNSSAVSFYLRTANFTNDNTLAYTCLLKMAHCLDLLGNRAFSVETTLQQAVALLPKRPEAYFLLSRFQERRSKYLDCYQNCSVGLEVSDFGLPPLPTSIDYPGRWGLLFERAVSSWHCGKEDQAREIFQKLIVDHWNDMDQSHRSCVEGNVLRLGIGPASKVHVPYTAKHHENLKFKFPGSESVPRNFSQVFQDMFVLYMLKGKRNGKFLEVGGGDPYWLNNSCQLETQFGWSGVSIEWNEELVKTYKNARPNINVLCRNALTTNYRALLQENYSSTDIDYLQLDVEPSGNTYEVLLRIPFDQYRFAVITYEHDYYVDVTKSYREKSRRYLTDMGYELVVSNVSPRENCPFEDWWVHPDLVDRELIEKIKTAPDTNTLIKTHFLTSKKKELMPETTSASLLVSFNPSYRKGFWVVDNFYQDPDAIRNFALKQEYHQGGLGHGYIGRRSFQQFLFPGLKEEFEKIMGEKITRWEEHGMNGRFQYNTEGEPLVYHCDDQKWAAMIYLTPNAPLETGTGSFALKGTKIFHNSQEGIMAAFRGDGAQNLDKTIFEPVDSIGNVYNRLVIFNAGYLHAALGYFGYKPENCRLWQMFFFD